MDDKDFLKHYGVPGMHWGRRKAGPMAKIHTKKEDKTSDDHKKKVVLKKKKLSEMSNVELKALNERLQLEKQYKSLTKEDISPGRKFVEEVLKNAAKQTVSNYTSKYMAKGVEDLLKKTTGG